LRTLPAGKRDLHIQQAVLRGLLWTQRRRHGCEDASGFVREARSQEGARRPKQEFVPIGAAVLRSQRFINFGGACLITLVGQGIGSIDRRGELALPRKTGAARQSQCRGGYHGAADNPSR
jgi:hypothetical protein